MVHTIPLSYTAQPTSLGDGQSGSGCSSSGGTGESLNVCLLICATNTLYTEYCIMIMHTNY